MASSKKQDHFKQYFVLANSAIPLIILLIYLSLPESPKFLILKQKKPEKALKALQFYFGTSVNYEKIFEIYREEEKKDGKLMFAVGLKFVFKYRKAMLIMTLGIIAVAFAEILAIYKPTIIEKILSTAEFSSGILTYGTVKIKYATIVFYTVLISMINIMAHPI